MPPRPIRRRTGANREQRLIAILAALLVGTGAGLWRAAQQRGHDAPVDLEYQVRVVDPRAGRLDVTLRVGPLPRHRLDLTFSGTAVAPTAPASKFRVRSARDEHGRGLAIERGDEGWSIRSAGPVEIEYEVHLLAGREGSQYADEALSHLDPRGGRLLGSDVFLFPDRAEIGTIDVHYQLPDGWSLHHPFPQEALHARPPSLKSLYTSVAAVGAYRTLGRRVGPCTIEIAVRGNYAFGDDDLMDVIERIVRHQVEFFGQVPRPRYLFVVDEHPHRDDPELLHYFGLHFDASMLVLIDPRTDRLRLTAEPASLCAHEFFHNWLGEQLRQEDYDMNWFVEGVTTLYSYRTRLATRMLDHGRYAIQLQERFREEWMATDPRAQLSLADAGTIVLQDAAVTRMLYTGGLLAAVSLDDEIMRSTAGEASLDDLVLALVDRAVVDPDYRLTREGVQTQLRELTGRDFGDWLDRHVYGLEELPLPGYVTGR